MNSEENKGKINVPNERQTDKKAAVEKQRKTCQITQKLQSV